MTRTRYRAALDGMALGMVWVAVTMPASETFLAAFFVTLLAIQARVAA